MRIGAEDPRPAMSNASLQWDEHNLQENQDERDNTAERMKIDEPKTPFVHTTSAPPMDEESMCTRTRESHSHASPSHTHTAFDLDDRAPPVSATSMGASHPMPAVSSSTDHADATHANTLANARSAQRTEELVHAVRPMPTSDSAPMQAPIDLNKINEELEDERARHSAFSEKRHQHYGNEAAALKMAAMLPDEDEDEDES